MEMMTVEITVMKYNVENVSCHKEAIKPTLSQSVICGHAAEFKS